MRKSPLLSTSALVGAMAMTLGACSSGGSGGGGGGGGVTPPTPVAGLVVLAPLVAVFHGASTSSNGSSTDNVSISDPDAPTATTFSGLTIDGDEDIRIRVSSGGVTIDQTLAKATYQGVGTEALGWAPSNAAQPPAYHRGVSTREWKSTAGTFTLMGLEETSNPAFGVNNPTPDLTDWVTLARWTVGTAPDLTRGYSLLGDPVSTTPATGVARFQGEAIGYLNNEEFIARAGLDIDFAAATVRGGVEDLTFRNVVTPDSALPGGPSTRYDFSFDGALSNGKFNATTITATRQTGETGFVRGQLYGPSGDLEVGGVFDISYTGGDRLYGGFVAGHPSDPGLTGSGPITLRPSFASLVTSAGSGAASYNRNDVEETVPGQTEFLRYTAGAFAAGDEGYGIYTNAGAQSVSAEFTAAQYTGLSTTFYRRPLANTDPIMGPTSRIIQASTWTSGATTLNSYNLGLLVNDAWIRPAYVQALEYVNPSLSAGVAQRVYTAIGSRTTTIPTTGSGRYKGEAFGVFSDNVANKLYRTATATTFDVLFASNEVRGAFSDFSFYDMNGAPVSSGVKLAGFGFTTSLTPTGSFESTPGSVSTVATIGVTGYNVTGRVRGDLFGPSASELGGIYSLNTLDGTTAAMAGVFVAGRNGQPPQLGFPASQTFTDTPGASLYAFASAPLTNISMQWNRKSPAPSDDTLALRFTRGGINQVANVTLGGGHDETSANGKNTELVIDHVNGGSNFLRVVERVAGVDLNYASLVGWYDQDALSNASTYVGFGQRATNMPTTGTAQYKGGAFAAYDHAVFTPGVPDPSIRHTVTNGDATMAVNFGAGTLSGATTGLVAPTGAPDLNFTFTGAIAGTEFTASFANAANTLAGPMKGLFAGPGAAEATATFQATTVPTGDTYQGGLVMVKQ